MQAHVEPSALSLFFRPGAVSALAPWLVAAVVAPVAAPSAAQPVKTYGASPAEEAAGTPRQLTAVEERHLSISIRRASDWQIRDWDVRQLAASRLGEGRMLELARARFEYELYADDSLYSDSVRDLHDLDTAEDVVLSAYGKLVRETLEDSLGLEAWYDRRRAGWRMSSSSADADGSSAPRPSSFRARLSPRLSDHYVGLRLRLPYTGITGLNHLSFRARYDFESGNPRYGLKYDDGARFVYLGYEPDTEIFGDELRLSVRLLW